MNTICPKIGAAQWSCTRDECTCHLKPGIWTKPNYPGDAVRQQIFSLDAELGDVRIMDYGNFRYRVAAFLPGETNYSPGDTPKTTPDSEFWCNRKDAANSYFELFVRAAYAAGWKDFQP